MSTSTDRRQLGFSFTEEVPQVHPTNEGRSRRGKKKPDRQLLLFQPYEQAELPIS